MQSILWVSVVFIFLIGGVVWYVLGRDTGISPREEAVMQDDTVIEKTGELAQYEGALLAGKSAPIFEFVKSDYEKALQTDKLIVLYFYANWCPICRKEQPALMAVFNERTKTDIIGFRVNYNDTATDADEIALAREFGVAYQHTKVFVKKGTQVLKSPESWTKDRYILEIAQALQ